MVSTRAEFASFPPRTLTPSPSCFHMCPGPLQVATRGKSNGGGSSRPSGSAADARQHFKIGTRYDLEYNDEDGEAHTSTNRLCLGVTKDSVQFYWGRSNYLIPFADITSHEEAPDRSKTLRQLRGGSRHTFRIILLIRAA